MKALFWRWSLFFEAEPVWGPTMLGCVVATLGAVGFALDASTRARTNRQRIIALAPATVLCFISLVILCSLVGHAREVHLRLMLSGEFRYRHFAPEREWLRMLAPIVVVALPALILAFGRVLQLRVLKWSASLVFVSSLTIVGSEYVFGLHWVDWFQNGRVASYAARLTTVLDALEIGVVLLGVSIVVVHAKRAPIRVARPTLMALLVFASGTGSLVATRGHAADRHRSLSMLSQPAHSELFPFAPKWLDECEPEHQFGLSYPIVSFEQHNVYVDGYLAHPVEMRTALQRPKRNWSILQPGRPFPGRLLVAVERDRPITELQPWLDAMYAAGFHRMVVTFDDSAKSYTHTLGYVSVQRYCGVELHLTPDADLAQRSIGEVVQAATKQVERTIGVLHPDGPHRSSSPEGEQ